MQVPSVSGLFQEKLGSVRSNVPGVPSAGFTSDFASALEAAKSSGETESFFEMNILPGEASEQAQQSAGWTPAQTSATTAASGGTAARSSSSAPLYIPASRAAALYGVTTGGSALGETICEFAEQYAGKLPYVRGGEDLETGVDCSGFTQQVFARFGISLPRSSYSQSKVGTEVSPDQLQSGDLMFFKTDDYAPVTHVALYIGDGKVVQAAGVKWGVIISKLKNDFATNSDFVVAKRIIPQ